MKNEHERANIADSRGRAAGLYAVELCVRAAGAEAGGYAFGRAGRTACGASAAEHGA